MDFEVEAYLERIGLAGVALAPNLDSLKAIHAAQLEKMPFENLNICMGLPIDVDLPSLQEKLVRHRRGGYCFELNGLLFGALQALGFTCRRIVGRIRGMRPQADVGGRCHMLLIVTLPEGRYIADVGCGTFASWLPLRLEHGYESTHGGITHRVRQTEDPEPLWVVGMSFNGKDGDVCEFTEAPVYDVDVIMGSHFCSTSAHPQATFTHLMTAQYMGADERRLLRDGKLTIFRHGMKVGEEEVISDDVVIGRLLSDFGIELPPGTVLRVPMPLPPKPHPLNPGPAQQ